MIAKLGFLAQPIPTCCTKTLLICSHTPYLTSIDSIHTLFAMLENHR